MSGGQMLGEVHVVIEEATYSPRAAARAVLREWLTAAPRMLQAAGVPDNSPRQAP